MKKNLYFKDITKGPLLPILISLYFLYSFFSKNFCIRFFNNDKDIELIKVRLWTLCVFIVSHPQYSDLFLYRTYQNYMTVYFTMKEYLQHTWHTGFKILPSSSTTFHPFGIKSSPNSSWSKFVASRLFFLAMFPNAFKLRLLELLS